MKWFKTEKFIYNPHTLQYEKVKLTPKQIAKKVAGLVLLMLVSGFVVDKAVNKFFPTTENKALHQEINVLNQKYSQINNQMDIMTSVLKNIKDRDEGVYRMIFGIDPIDEAMWNGGVGGHDFYRNFKNFTSKEILVNSIQKADKLSRQMTLMSESLDEIEKLASDKETFLASIPSIKPVKEDKLRRKIKYLSGYGMRIHPVHKIPKMHEGLDFSAPTGTEIQATGDGRVIHVENKKTGYGKNVIVDHGYGYKTLYGHMSEIIVKKGDRVKKGQLIGKIGSTGTSTAPHLHYEVRYKGKAVNPINYVMDGLTPEEYDELVRKSQESQKSFD